MGFTGGESIPPGGALNVIGSLGIGGPGGDSIAALPMIISTFGLAIAIGAGKVTEPVFQGSSIGNDPSPYFGGRGAIGAHLVHGSVWLVF